MRRQRPGSLRDAVAAAAPGDNLYLYGLSCSVITLTSGAIEVPQYTLDIKYYAPGLGHGSRFTIDAHQSDRVFHHTGTGELGLTITGIRARWAPLPISAHMSGNPCGTSFFTDGFDGRAP